MAPQALEGTVLLAAGVLAVLLGLPRAVHGAGRTGSRAAQAAHRQAAAVRARLRQTGAVRVGQRVAAAALGSVSAVLVLVAPARAASAPERAAVASTAPAAPSAHPVAAPSAASVVVVVRPGDTLWDIARRHLPRGATDAQVARAWPRWYAANRAVIGPDPALIRPGQRLRPPDARPTGTSSSPHHRSPSEDDAASSFDPDRR